MRLRILIILTAFLISGCSGLNLFEPTPTSTPLPTATIEPTKTAIPTPTISPTPDLLAEYTSMLFPIPSGFEWKVVPDLKLAIVIPDGWYFKRDPRTNLGFAGGIYVTKENIDEVGRFSTGQSVFMYPNIEDDPESFATGVLYDLATSETTTKILDSWDYKTG